jgi:hypothetical protein
MVLHHPFALSRVQQAAPFVDPMLVLHLGRSHGRRSAPHLRLHGLSGGGGGDGGRVVHEGVVVEAEGVAGADELEGVVGTVVNAGVEGGSFGSGPRGGQVRERRGAERGRKAEATRSSFAALGAPTSSFAALGAPTSEGVRAGSAGHCGGKGSRKENSVRGFFTTHVLILVWRVTAMVCI